MAFMAAALPYISAAATILGGMSQADSMRDAAKANAENARRAAEANKQQADYAAGQAEASSQHAAEAKRRKATLMLSRAQAIAAASGGGPLDETIASGLIEEGEKDAGFSLYEGTERGKGLRYKGDVGVYEANQQGRAEIKAANKAANATMLGAFAKAGMSMASQFAPSAAPGSEYPRGNNPDEWDF